LVPAARVRHPGAVARAVADGPAEAPGTEPVEVDVHRKSWPVLVSAILGVAVLPAILYGLLSGAAYRDSGGDPVLGGCSTSPTPMRST
jgi:hypothetical protein